MKIKTGDKVIVISGKNRGQSGTVVRALPDENKVVIDGINIAKRHRKPTATNRQGQIVEKAMPVHVSNVMLADPKTGKPTRVKIVRDEKSGRTRVAVKSGHNIA